MHLLNVVGSNPYLHPNFNLLMHSFCHSLIDISDSTEKGKLMNVLMFKDFNKWYSNYSPQRKPERRRKKNQKVKCPSVQFLICIRRRFEDVTRALGFDWGALDDIWDLSVFFFVCQEKKNWKGVLESVRCVQPGELQLESEVLLGSMIRSGDDS